MRVVRQEPDGSLTVLGRCSDWIPPRRPGDTIRLPVLPYPGLGPYDPETDGPVLETAAYRCILAIVGGEAEVAVRVLPDGPDPRHLPGWEPAAG